MEPGKMVARPGVGCEAKPWALSPELDPTVSVTLAKVVLPGTLDVGKFVFSHLIEPKNSSELGSTVAVTFVKVA